MYNDKHTFILFTTAAILSEQLQNVKSMIIDDLAWTKLLYSALPEGNPIQILLTAYALSKHVSQTGTLQRNDISGTDYLNTATENLKMNSSE